MDKIQLSALYYTAIEHKDFNQIKEILAILNHTTDSQKMEYLELYEKIDNDLFQLNRSESNNNIDKFKKDIKEWNLQRKVAAFPNSEKVDVTESNEDFDIVFKKYYERHQAILNKLKDFHFLKLEQSNELVKIEVVILCDDDSIKRPELNQIKAKETVLNVRMEILKDFLTAFDKTPEKASINYICLLCLTPSLREGEPIETLKQTLKNLVLSFNKIFSLEVICSRNGDYETYKISTFLEENIIHLIESANKVFNNSKLSYNEQKIIKLFYGSHPTVIDYKVLKPGASGSAVIEVQGNQTLFAGSKRYVVKTAKKVTNNQSKLTKEKKNFDDYVRPNQTHGYDAEFKDNDTYEAIRYVYASTDSVSDSISFFDLINNYLNKDNVASSDIVKNLNALFKIEILTKWNFPKSCTISVKSLYESYLKSEAIAIDVIQEIKNITTEEVYKSDLVIKYRQLLEKNIDVYTKVCHGDLHTENFFWDNSDIYLIDFGHTGVHHAVVDHTFLEISIRLRHFPNYVAIDEYMKYEEKMLCKESFEPGFDLSFIQRKKIKTLYELIYNIRLDAKKYCYNKETLLNEYLISLFVISFRLTQYRDLNPLLSLKMTELLLFKIDI